MIMRGCAVFFGGLVLSAVTALGQAPPPAPEPVGDGVWTKLAELPPVPPGATLWVNPRAYTVWTVDPLVLMNLCAPAPMEGTPRAVLGDDTVISLPTMDGVLGHFRVIESPNMEPDLQAQYPMIRSFAVESVEFPGMRGRIDFSPRGFRAMIATPEGDFFIQPPWDNDQFTYMLYTLRDRTDMQGVQCHGADQIKGEFIEPQPAQNTSSGPTRRNYRLAMAATGEYTAGNGGTVVSAMAAINTLVNNLNVIYEREITMRLTLVANNDLIVFTNAGTDPFTGNSTGTMLGEVSGAISSRISTTTYDVGHVITGLNIGGVANLGVTCTTNKARGVSGQIIGDDAYNAFIVAHEMGHQMNARHTFNGANGGCGGNRDSVAAYEPGSGYTNMSYTAGICGSDDLGLGPSAQYHSDSYDRIRTWLTTVGGGVCNNTTNTGNSAPAIDAGLSFTIPANTPFVLTPASFSDPQGHTLSFSWEQRNLDNQANGTALVAGDTGINPIIRTLPFSSSPSRQIPANANLLANNFAPGEILPATNRTLNFRVTARDGLGGVNDDDMAVTVVVTPAPFSVTSFNSATTIIPGPTNITWEVAGTNVAPFNAANVQITYSTDGGQTFPTVLAASVPNTGSASVNIPSVDTTGGRIRISAIGNIFFDINNASFTVIANPICPTISSQPASVTTSFADTVTFSVAASGTNPLTYQWRRNGVNLSNNARYSGVTTNQLRITTVSSGDVGTFDVVISNICGQVTSDTATLALFCNAAWSATAAPALTQRDGAGMAFDSNRGVAVLFGGVTPGLSDDHLEWDGAGWAARTLDTKPAARQNAAMAYDSDRGVTVLYGGQNADGSVLFGDLWEFDGSAWTQRTIAGPNPPAGAFSMAYDSDRGVIVLWADTALWEFDGAAWTQRVGSSLPGGVTRRRPAMGYDTARRLVLIYGGRDAANAIVGSLYEWNSVNWVLRSVATNPGVVADAAFSYDPARRRFNLFGGQNASGPLSTSWTWDGTTWRSVTTVPPTRARGAMAFDARRNENILVGGTGNAPRTDTWRFGNTLSFNAMPAGASISAGSDFMTSVSINGTPSTQRWRRDNAAINNGAEGASTGGGSVSGALTTALTITGAQAADAGSYTYFMSNTCGTMTSQPATLDITTNTCLVDYNNDGVLNQEDLSGFLTAFLDEAVPPGPSGTNAAPCPGEPTPYDTLGYAADYNRDCSFNQEDLAGYITEFFLESENPTNCIPG